MPKLSRLLPKEIKQLKFEFETHLKFYRSILGVISQSFSWKHPVSFDMRWNFQEYPYFCQFYYRKDRERLLKFVDFSRKWTKKSET